MARRRSRSRRRYRRRFSGDCSFCTAKKVPDYKDVKQLGEYLTERGKIVSRGRSGLCAKHQRRLSIAVKRARFLALVPYTQRL